VKYVQGLGGVEEASVIGASYRTTAINAALANAMCAHADETDDFEPVTKAHPGSSVVPAALAMAEKQGCTGQDFIRAVTLGYDMSCRLLMALGPDLLRGASQCGGHQSTRALARGVVGAARRRMRAHAISMPRSRCQACGAG
jgi:2-methylcitrate dehydratase PrpD